jgi:DNA-binding NarL/FixJ family response regulator
VTDPLSTRDREVAELSAEGLSVREIALALDIGEQNVKNRRSAIFRRYGVKNAAALARAMAEEATQ